MEAFIADLPPAAVEGLDTCYVGYFSCFNAGQYYEAHDVLEHLWLVTRGKDADFFKALIQVAGAYVHLKKQFERPDHPKDGRRLSPAARLFRLAGRTLERYPAHHHHLDVNALARHCRERADFLESTEFTRNPWHPHDRPVLELQPDPREALLNQLRVYGTKFPDEIESVERFIGFVSEHPDCFERSLEPGHVTGSAWLVDQTGTQVLLTHHKKLERWLQLGGHADGDSDILNVARREVAEESGLTRVEPVTPEIFDLDIHPIPARGEVPGHFHYDVRYAMRAPDGEAYVVSDESHDLAWIEIDRLQELTEESSMWRMAKKWVDGRW